MKRLVALSLVVALFSWSCARLHRTESFFLRTGKTKLEHRDYARALLAFKNAAKLAPQDPEPLYEIAVAYQATGNIPFSIGYLRKAIAVDPKYYPAHLKLAEILSAGASGNQQLLAEAEQHARTAIQSKSEEAEAWRVLGLTFWREGKRKEAEEILAKTVQSFPKDSRAALALANVELAQRRWDEAKRLFRTVIQEHPQNAQALLGLAVLAVQEGKMVKADRIYRQISSIPAEKYRSLHAQFLLHAGYPERAIRELKQLIQQNPRDQSICAALVNAYVVAHQEAAAKQLLDKVLHENPSNKQATLQRARLEIKLGSTQQAQLDLNRLLHLEPNSADAHYLQAAINRRRGEYLQARQELSTTLALDSAYLPARLELAELLIKANAARSALEVCNAAPKSQDKAPGLIVERNRALAALGDLAELRASIDKGLETARIPELVLQDGALKLRQRDFAGARTDARAALSQEPDSVEALNLLARSYTAQKQISAAIKAVREYAASRPSSVPVRQFLAEMLAANGNLDQSRQTFDRLRKNPAGAANASLALAQIDLAQGKLDDAARLLTPFAERGDRAATLWLAVVETHKQEFRAAIAGYRRVLASEPTNLVALNNLSFLLSEHGGNPAEALKFAQSAAEQAPQDADIEGTLAIALYRNGLFKRARQYMNDAVSRKDNAIRRYYLSLIDARLGYNTQSRSDLQAAIRLDPAAIEVERQHVK